jgi:hypothetical protein
MRSGFCGWIERSSAVLFWICTCLLSLSKVSGSGPLELLPSLYPTQCHLVCLLFCVSLRKLTFFATYSELAVWPLCGHHLSLKPFCLFSVSSNHVRFLSFLNIGWHKLLSPGSDRCMLGSEHQSTGEGQRSYTTRYPFSIHYWALESNRSEFKFYLS